jgi:hypothetical protein
MINRFRVSGTLASRLEESGISSDAVLRRHNRLFFRADDMAQPFVTHNAELLELLAPQLEIELSQFTADSLKTQVKTILKKLLAGNRPRLQVSPANYGSALGRYSADFLKRDLRFTR